MITRTRSLVSTRSNSTSVDTDNLFSLHVDLLGNLSCWKGIDDASTELKRAITKNGPEEWIMESAESGGDSWGELKGLVGSVLPTMEPLNDPTVCSFIALWQRLVEQVETLKGGKNKRKIKKVLESNLDEMFSAENGNSKAMMQKQINVFQEQFFSTSNASGSSSSSQAKKKSTTVVKMESPEQTGCDVESQELVDSEESALIFLTGLANSAYLGKNDDGDLTEETEEDADASYSLKRKHTKIEPVQVSQNEETVCVICDERIVDEDSECIGCDYSPCGGWFHRGCVGFDDWGTDDLPQPWFCPSCVRPTVNHLETQLPGKPKRALSQFIYERSTRRKPKKPSAGGTSPNKRRRKYDCKPNSMKRNPHQITIIDLVNDGFLKTGDIITVPYLNKHRFEGVVNEKGLIEFEQQTFVSPPSFALFCKRKIYKDKQSDRGWTSCFHGGVPLLKYRNLVLKQKMG